MTEIQKTYREVLKEIAGPKWKQDSTSMQSNAGIAIALSVMDDGLLTIPHLKQRLPDFSQTDIRSALARLRRNGYFMREEGRYKLVIDKGIEVGGNETIFFALLGAVAQGWIERSNK
jgi:hypothetical protein